MLKLLKYLKPFRNSVILVMVLLFFQALSQLYLPTLMADIVDVGIVQGDTGYILKVGAVMLGVALAGAGLMIASGYLSARVATGFGKVLRSKVFVKVEKFSLHEFNQIGTASLITRTTNDITQIQRVTMNMLRLMVMAPMMGIGGIVMALSKDPGLSRTLIVVIPVLSVGTWWVTRHIIPLFRQMQVKLDKLNLVLREGLTGVRVIRAFNRTGFEQRRFDRANCDLTDTAIRVNRIMAAMMPAMMVVMNFTTVIIIWLGGIRIQNGHLQVGELMAFIQYVMQIMFSLVMASMMFIMVPRASASALRINEVLNMEPEITDPPATRTPTESRGRVEFSHVTFSYPGAERPAVSDVTFSAGRGEVTAIIGGTGSGKSTLVSLILRFFDVQEGSVMVDGVDIREMTQADLRARIGFVPQNSVLFSGTIAENIGYGKDSASAEEVIAAAEVAQANEFIAGMNQGYDSAIAQGGTNISGGQKQRLSIARALVRRPEIYIFDDSFSALDFKTEAKLRRALQNATTESTVILVAQRVSTVISADQIIVLDEGRVVGIGTHKELLETCEVYQEIVFSQLSEEELA